MNQRGSQRRDPQQPTRPLGWLRERHELVRAFLSSTRPVVGDLAVALEGSDALHQRWITDNAALFAEEGLLLRDIAARTAEVAAAAHGRADIVPAVTGILPALGQEDTRLTASTIEKIAIYQASYAEPGQPVAEVLRAAVTPGTTRYRELASIANDLGAVLEATADTDEALYALWTSGVDLDAPDVPGEPSTYQDYVGHGVFAAYGRRSGGLASSFDDHYIGPFGDDWGNGEPAYDIGPSGSDEEHYAELAQYRLWLTARGLRRLEAAGHKAIPHGTNQFTVVDRFLTTSFGPWLLDNSDPAIRAAAALEHGRLDAIVFNTPDTQWVLEQGVDWLRHLGLNDDLATAMAKEAGRSQAPAPWVRGDVEGLLAAPAPSEVSEELAALAGSAPTAALLAWVKQAQLPRPTPPQWQRQALELHTARHLAHSLSGHRDEKQLELQGLRQDLQRAGPRWWPGNRRRRGDLERRIGQREQAVERLDREVREADADLARVAQESQASRRAWETSHTAVTDRGRLAAQELQRRENDLLDGYLRDPPQHLLEAIGPPPADPAGQQAWRDHARELERGRAGDTALDQAALSIVGGRGTDRPTAGPPAIGEDDAGDSWRTHRDRADQLGQAHGWTAPELPPPGDGNWLDLGRDEGPAVDLEP